MKSPRKIILIFSFLILFAGMSCELPAYYVDTTYEPEPIFHIKDKQIFFSRKAWINWVIVTDRKTKEVIWDIRGVSREIEVLRLGEVPQGFCEYIKFDKSRLAADKEYTLIIPGHDVGWSGDGLIFTIRK